MPLCRYKPSGYSYHEGDAADPRMTAAASKRGVRLTSRSRPLQPADFKRFKYIVGMDANNMRAILVRSALAWQPTFEGKWISGTAWALRTLWDTLLARDCKAHHLFIWHLSHLDTLSHQSAADYWASNGGGDQVPGLGEVRVWHVVHDVLVHRQHPRGCALTWVGHAGYAASPPVSPTVTDRLKLPPPGGQVRNQVTLMTKYCSDKYQGATEIPDPYCEHMLDAVQRYCFVHTKASSTPAVVLSRASWE